MVQAYAQVVPLWRRSTGVGADLDVMDEDGTVKSFCVYSSPDTELIREHAGMLGDHTITGLYEIGGDISPDDFE